LLVQAQGFMDKSRMNQDSTVYNKHYLMKVLNFNKYKFSQKTNTESKKGDSPSSSPEEDNDDEKRTMKKFSPRITP